RLSYTNGCQGGAFADKLFSLHVLHRIGCFPASRCCSVPGGFVRLIRSVSMVRLGALLLGLSVCLPLTADAAQKTTRKKSTTTRTPSTQTSATPKVARQSAYSASEAQAR